MARSDSAGEGLGAIAGSADGSVCNNYFLDEGLSGVNSVNYEGKAMPLDLNSFSALELVPEEFLHLTVTFRVDGQEVAVRRSPMRAPCTRTRFRRFRSGRVSSAPGPSLTLPALPAVWSSMGCTPARCAPSPRAVHSRAVGRGRLLP